MDLLDKCNQFNTVEKYKSLDLYPYFRQISSGQGSHVTINSQEYLMLGSNSYLSLTNHPDVIQASVEATQKYGTGNAGSRFLNGTLDIHHQLEEKFARFAQKESALLYGTGWMTNLGVISALVGRNDVVLLDRMNHSSLFDGARLSMAKKVIKYKHNDMYDLEEHIKRILEKLPDAGLLIISDGVFSMEGDLVKLPELVKIAKKYKARIMIDDAHGLGVLGSNGEGTVHHFGLQNEVDLITYTFSKSLASLGGVVVASNTVINFLKHLSRPVIFSASIPASSVASTSKALDIMLQEPERRERLWEVTHKMASSFKKLGFDTGVSETPIIPIFIGSTENTFQFWKSLKDEGIFVNPVIAPAVPENQGTIRTSYTFDHTDEQLDLVLEVFEKIGKKLKII